MSKLKTLDNVTITATAAAKLIGKSGAWLARLVAAGFVERRDGLYRPNDVAQGALAFTADAQRRASKTATLAEVQAARAREINLRIAREDHEIIALDEAMAVVDEIVGGLKGDLYGLAASITRDAVLRGAIDARVEEIFKRAADRVAQAGGALRASGSAVAADAPDDA
jgi:hypothetical protein